MTDPTPSAAALEAAREIRLLANDGISSRAMEDVVAIINRALAVERERADEMQHDLELARFDLKHTEECWMKDIDCQIKRIDELTESNRQLEDHLTLSQKERAYLAAELNGWQIRAAAADERARVAQEALRVLSGAAQYRHHDLHLIPDDFMDCDGSACKRCADALRATAEAEQKRRAQEALDENGQ